jgi:hypothetical protein
MTVLTLVGRVADQLGHAMHRRIGWDGHSATETRTFSAFPAGEYRELQPASIPVNLNHRTDRLIGEVVHLEEHGGAIVAVATVSGPNCIELLKNAGPRYWSAEFDHLDGRDIELTGLAVVDRPAYSGLRPIEVHVDDVRDPAWRSRHSALNPDRLLERAAATHQHHRLHRREPHRIANHTQADPPEYRHLDIRAAGTHESGRWITLPTGERAPLEIRPARITHVEGRPIGARL